MIPREAVGELCLLILINEPAQIFSVGLVRPSDNILNKPNQDLKRSLSTIGKGTIRWIVNRGRLPVSIFLQMPVTTRDAIWNHKSGQKRVKELFRQVQKVPILRSDIVALAKQDDPTKRARDAKSICDQRAYWYSVEDTLRNLSRREYADSNSNHMNG